VTFAFIRDHQDAFPVQFMCETLGVSSSGYYAWRDRPASKRAARRTELAEKIQDVHQANRCVYGSPRVHRALLARGEKVCRNTVAKVMRTHGIRARTHRRFKARTTDADHPHPIAPNTLNRNFACSRLNQVWLTDITYIHTGEGFLYLAGVMDLCSRRIIGWSMADHLRAELVGDALKMALATRGFKDGAALPDLLHHSDRGVQYACDEYQALLRRHGIAVSMSNTGDCYDNAPKESFWGKLKTELVHHQRFAARAQARAAVFDYIEVFYNRQRLHSSLDYTSPERFEAGLT
jgi:putative transposase